MNDVNIALTYVAFILTAASLGYLYVALLSIVVEKAAKASKRNKNGN